MNQLIACCGLDCAQCDARKAIINNDNVLREVTAKSWSEMNNAPQITAETINCLGCREDGVKFAYCGHYCPIRKCVLERGFQTCADCADMEHCERVAQIIQNNPNAKENLQSL